MVDPVWHVLTNAYLKDMLELCRSAMQRQVDKNISATFPGALELTLPWGMDDGDAVVRRTGTGDHHPERGGSDQRRFAVVVFAEAVRFGEALDPPRFPGRDGAPERRRSVPTLARSIAEYLREQTGGEPLEEVGDGSLRFAVLAWPRPLTG
jgi:hypothetical protein